MGTARAVNSSASDLVPARILNEHVYCPRLAYLMWADREFRDNAATAEGSFAHRQVDRPTGELGPSDAPGPESADERVTSLWLSSERSGITAKVDVVERDGRWLVPVEYKRGHPVPGIVLREPERVQLAAQVMLLREAGYAVPYAEVYFSTARSRHRIEIDGELVQRVLAVVDEVRANAARDEAPPRLVDSPKCPHCVLVGLCLPDEVGYLTRARTERPRRLVARDSPARPLYLTEQRARLSKRKGRLVLLVEGEEIESVRLFDVSHVAVFGNATVSSAALRACFESGIPVLWFTYAGWFAGFAGPLNGGSVRVRMRQHRAAMVGTPAIAGQFVAGKIKNARTMLRRHLAHEAAAALEQLASLARQAQEERRFDALLGIEGTAARIYFSRFAAMLHAADEVGVFDFTARNRRPPRDPVNALLSFTYAMLVKDTTAALVASGLDPYVGLYHRPGFGRPALALDLVEEFRPLIADSVVLRMVNNGEIRARDFIRRAGAVALTDGGRRRVIAAYERRMEESVRHPVFAYSASYRRMLEVQARLLAAVLCGELPEYRPLTTR